MSGENQRFSRLFALVIGINDYSHQKLRGAVHDANSMRNFLVEDLQANPQHITTLQDREATRNSILESLKALARDPRIQKDDPIVIYYAGHGARGDPPTGWTDWASNDGQVEMICPVDITLYAKIGDGDAVPLRTFLEPSQGQDVAVVPGIPDRTIGALLNRISDAKGNNITVILDCCHAAGLNRALDYELTARMILNPPPFPPNCDFDIFEEAKSEVSQTLSGIKARDQDSYVLLAACGRKESALEKKTNRSRGGMPARTRPFTSTTGFTSYGLNEPSSAYGIFTWALLHHLSSNRWQKFTYNSLIKSIKLQNQTPHCFGRNIDRPLFDIKSVGADVSLIRGHVHYDSLMREPSIVLEAGAVHGIQEGARVAIYRSDLLRTLDVSLGILQVADVQDYTATLQSIKNGSARVSELDSAINRDSTIFFARELGSTLSVFSNELSRLKKSLDTAVSPHYDAMLSSSIVFTQDADKAQVQVIYEITKGSSRVYFQRRKTDAAVRYIGTRFPCELSAEDSQGILNFLYHASRFYRHLNVSNPDQEVMTYLTPDGIRQRFLNGIEVQFFQLSKGTFDWDIQSQGPNKIQGNKINLVVKPEDKWGMNIYNNTDVHLHLHLFLFDARDLSIEPWYLPPTGYNSTCAKCTPDPEEGQPGGVDFPLEAHSNLSVGYGDSSVSPWSFELPDGAGTDLGFLKLYFTQRAVDMRSLEQQSAFKLKTSAPTVSEATNEKRPTPSSSQWITQTDNADQAEVLSRNGEDKIAWLLKKSLSSDPVPTREVRGRAKGQDKDVAAASWRGEVWAAQNFFLIQRRPVPT